ncbi:TraR/DksA family transcriptional regulator [Aromatoleum sp.]|uniref:TraR/DksA family transcriptional regulator n=1 Tax=Aromatoleum sp. TaxID=2307007 RepID=UPI002FCAD87C
MATLTEEQTRQLRDAMEQRRVTLLGDIDTALQRMDSASYGTCIDCEVDIRFERLVAFPTATRCIQCAERREKTYVGGATPSL